MCDTCVSLREDKHLSWRGETFIFPKRNIYLREDKRVASVFLPFLDFFLTFAAANRYINRLNFL